MALVGTLLQLAGLAWDLVAHHADRHLVAREGVLSLSNPSHMLMAIGMAATVAGVAWGFGRALLTAPRPRSAVIAVALLFSFTVSTGAVALALGVDSDHRSADGKTTSHLGHSLRVDDPALADLRRALARAGTRAALDRLWEQVARGGARGGHVHRYAHEIGRSSLWRYGGDAARAFRHCDERFEGACYHGVVIAHLERQDRVSIGTVRRTCGEIIDGLRNRFLAYQCVHGMGHGLNARARTRLPRALSLCDALTRPQDRANCHGGAFMDRLLAGTDRRRQQADSHYPCSALPARYGAACYEVQSAVILRETGRDLSTAFGQCDGAPARFIAACYRGLGRDIVALARENGRLARDLCSEGSNRYRHWCFEGVARLLVSESANTRSAIGFCAAVSGGARRGCFELVGRLAFRLDRSAVARRAACAAAREPSWVDVCLRSAGIFDGPAGRAVSRGARRRPGNRRARAAVTAIGRVESAPRRSTRKRAVERSPKTAVFTDASVRAGVRARHDATTVPAGAWRRRYRYPITGQAWGDYNKDGRPDLYLTSQAGPNTLLRNQGDGSFRRSELSRAVSLPRAESGGAVFADYDNDGWQDLFVLNYGRDALFHNERGRGFADVTRAAGIADGGAGTTATWGDYDQDGLLDLYIVNYGCNACAYPSPGQGHRDRLYHNNGDGSFTDATASLPAEAVGGWGFAASWLDYDNDRDLDLYLVNDVRGTRYLPVNALFRNDGRGCGGWCFSDVSDSTDANVRVDGMGLAAGDYDNDRDLDLYMSNTGWAHMPLTGAAVLLRNQRGKRFQDVSHASRADVDAVGWGTVFLDYDNDGWQDLYLALGLDPEGLGDYVRRNRLLRNQSDGAFADVSSTSGASRVEDSFGVATADYNGDGWTDLVVGNIDKGYRLYANAARAGSDNRRIIVRLTGAGPVNRDAVGATVELTTANGRTQLKQVLAGSSLGAGNDLPLHFGLGRSRVARIVVIWPDGRRQSFGDVPSGVRWSLRYGGTPSVAALESPSVPATAVHPVEVTPRVRPGGYAVPALAALSTLGLLGWLLSARLGRRRLARDLALGLALSAVMFQLGHFVEHLLQAGHWAGDPGEQPWITPWGLVATDALTALSGHHGGVASGTELLHLLGNWITLIGLGAACAILSSRGVVRWSLRAPRIGFGLQLVHVAEHVALSTTFFAFGRPIGMSTLLGFSFSLGGAWASSIRLWWHFGMNLAVTIACVIALDALLRARPRGRAQGTTRHGMPRESASAEAAR